MVTGALSVVETVKPCAKCGSLKFAKGSGRCSACAYARSQAWRAANPERARAQGRASAARRYAANPEPIRTRSRERNARWRAANPELSRERSTHYSARRAGILEIDYETQLAFQNGACPGCLKQPDKQRLHRDHDHATGAIRGLLCKACNLALGNAADDPETLRRLAGYLERPPFHAWVRSVANEDEHADLGG